MLPLIWVAFSLYRSNSNKKMVVHTYLCDMLIWMFVKLFLSLISLSQYNLTAPKWLFQEHCYGQSSDKKFAQWLTQHKQIVKLLSVILAIILVWKCFYLGAFASLHGMIVGPLCGLLFRPHFTPTSCVLYHMTIPTLLWSLNSGPCVSPAEHPFFHLGN